MRELLMQLRWSIAGAVLLAVIGVATAYYYHLDLRRATAELAQARAASLSASASLAAAHAERQDIVEFLPRYRVLERLGAFGDERRLDWIERMDAIRAELKSPRLIYTIAPRAPLPERPEPVAGLGYEGSRVKIEFDLLHEGDLFHLLRRLSQPVMGFAEFQSCTLRRVPRMSVPTAREEAPTDGEPNLTGDCQLDWVSLIAARPAEAATDAGTALPATAARPPGAGS
ncbi:MAG: hypothetical protein JNM79_04775 [Burkholderiales bacterium]|nr:hypothetical protein [Burkholderiales bacterium]